MKWNTREKFSEAECGNEDRMTEDKSSSQMTYFKQFLKDRNLGWFILYIYCLWKVLQGVVESRVGRKKRKEILSSGPVHIGAWLMVFSLEDVTIMMKY